MRLGSQTGEGMGRVISGGRMGRKVLVLFGTRPEAIKLAPVIRALGELGDAPEVCNVASSQHVELLRPFLRTFRIEVGHDLGVMAANQTPSDVCARVIRAFDDVLVRERPDLVLVQGDTTTAMAGALASFHRRVPVGHVEAGLRSGDVQSPFPEEMNRQLVSRLATWHFAPTERGRRNLEAEGVPSSRVWVTGNTVVDALQWILKSEGPSEVLTAVLRRTEGRKRLVVTMHRRESFGGRLEKSLGVLNEFLRRHPEAVVIFPVHPNPVVREAVHGILGGRPGALLIEPLDYVDFVHLLANAWLIASDSGGVQEEAPSLGKPVLILRDNTERPEAIEAGFAQLVGPDAGRLSHLLEEAWAGASWCDVTPLASNPFGAGDSGVRIARIVGRVLEGAEDSSS